MKGKIIKTAFCLLIWIAIPACAILKNASTESWEYGLYTEHWSRAQRQTLFGSCSWEAAGQRIVGKESSAESSRWKLLSTLGAMGELAEDKDFSDELADSKPNLIGIDQRILLILSGEHYNSRFLS